MSERHALEEWDGLRPQPWSWISSAFLSVTTYAGCKSFCW